MIRDFKSFKNPSGLVNAGGVPIIGSEPPPIVLDALGRQLQTGDFVILQTPHNQPFRVQSVVPVPTQPGEPPLLQITLSSTSAFLSYRNVPNQEFLRVMTADEIEERKKQGEESAGFDKGTAKPTDQVGTQEPEAPPQTLGDA